MAAKGQGSTFAAIGRAEISTLDITLHSLEEQRRIVDLLSRAENIVRMRREAEAKAKEIIPALFVDMFGSGLTTLSNGRREAEHSNAVVPLGDSDLIQIIDGDRGSKYPKKDDFQKDGYCLFLNTSNVRRGDWDFTHCDFISRTKDEELRKGRLKRQDLVLTTRGTLGNTAFFGDSVPFENVRINSGMVILRSVSQHLMPQYLLGVLNSTDFLRQVKNATSGSAQQQLPIGTLSRIRFPLPELAKQMCFAGHAKRAQELEESTIGATRLADQSFQSLLAGVFGNRERN